MGKKAAAQPEPPPADSSLPALSLVVEVRRQTIHDIKMPDGCCVHVYDYNRRWTDAVVEPDDDGVMCKQTIYSRQGKHRDTPYKFRISIHTGVIKRLILPHGGCKVIVKTYDKDEGPCTEQKWVRKK